MVLRSICSGHTAMSADRFRYAANFEALGMAEGGPLEIPGRFGTSLLSVPCPSRHRKIRQFLSQHLDIMQLGCLGLLCHMLA